MISIRIHEDTFVAISEAFQVQPQFGRAAGCDRGGCQGLVLTMVAAPSSPSACAAGRLVKIARQMQMMVLSGFSNTSGFGMPSHAASEITQLATATARAIRLQIFTHESVLN
jgi:hypothetical protein